MNRILKILPYLTILALSLYLLPTLIDDEGMQVMLLISLIPPISFAVSAIYSAKVKRMDRLFVILSATVFIPAVITPNFSLGLLSPVVFWLIGLLGSAVGFIFTTREN